MAPFVMAMASLLAAASAAAQPSSWQSGGDDAELAFSVVYENVELTGRFGDFQVRLTMDSDTGEGRLNVTVRVASADMNDLDINAEIRQAGWFDTAAYPLAEFSSTSLRSAGRGTYVALGTLSLKGIERRIEVPYDWTSTEDSAHMTGQLELSRSDWNIGQGEWASDELLADRVLLKFSVPLCRVN